MVSHYFKNIKNWLTMLWNLLWDPYASTSCPIWSTARWWVIHWQTNRIFIFASPWNFYETNWMWWFFDYGNSGWHKFWLNLMNLTRWNLSFIARATIQLWAFDKSIWVSITNDWTANFTTKTFRVESMVASNHYRPRNQLRTCLTAFTKLPPVIIFAE